MLGRRELGLEHVIDRLGLEEDGVVAQEGNEDFDVVVRGTRETGTACVADSADGGWCGGLFSREQCVVFGVADVHARDAGAEVWELAGLEGCIVHLERSEDVFSHEAFEGCVGCSFYRQAGPVDSVAVSPAGLWVEDERDAVGLADFCAVFVGLFDPLFAETTIVPLSPG